MHAKPAPASDARLAGLDRDLDRLPASSRAVEPAPDLQLGDVIHPVACMLDSSSAGLPGASINKHESISRMDCRVKPGKDDGSVIAPPPPRAPMRTTRARHRAGARPGSPPRCQACRNNPRAGARRG